MGRGLQPRGGGLPSYVEDAAARPEQGASALVTQIEDQMAPPLFVLKRVTDARGDFHRRDQQPRRHNHQALARPLGQTAPVMMVVVVVVVVVVLMMRASVARAVAVLPTLVPWPGFLKGRSSEA